MIVLSLFDGISCARVALERAGFEVERYFASEIDKYAIQIAQKNYGDTIHLADVKSVSFKDGFVCDIRKNPQGDSPPYIARGIGCGSVDLLIGGSPCQDLSIAKKNRQGLDGERSGLFWEYVRILQEVRPKRFVLENVNSMPKEAKELITKTLGVEPIMINAALVSAQNRKRLFWTNIPGVTQPEDRGILLKDILEDGAEVDERMVANGKSFAVTASYNGAVEWNSVEKRQRTMVRVGQFGKGGQGDRVYSPEGKSVSLSALGGGRGAKTGLYLVVPEATKKGYTIAQEGDSVDLSYPKSKTRRGRVGNKAKNIMSSSQSIGVFKEGVVRKLTPVECERLQGLPDNYTAGISNTQRYKCLGNAFNVDVVAHILSFIPTS